MKMFGNTFLKTILIAGLVVGMFALAEYTTPPQLYLAQTMKSSSSSTSAPLPVPLEESSSSSMASEDSLLQANVDLFTSTSSVPAATSLIVKFKPTVDASQKSKIAGALRFTVVPSTKVGSLPNGLSKLGYTVVNVPVSDSYTAEQAKADFLRAHADKVDVVEVDKVYKAHYTPNDPLLSTQWHHTF